MKNIAYDIETDGLLDTWTGKGMSKIHCIVLRDLDTDEVRCYHESETIKPRHGGLLDALPILAEAEVRTAHNGVGFDDPVLSQLGFKSELDTFDTLAVSRMLWPDMAERDYAKASLPKHLRGRHSLEAWGLRIGVHKQDFGKSAFAVFTEAMLLYCIQDTAVLAALYHLERKELAKRDIPDRAWQLECRFAEVLSRQERMGVCFDVPLANKLWREWEGELIQIDERLSSEIEPWVKTWVTPKKRLERSKEEPFNPASRLQIGRLYTERYGVAFEEYTEGGQPVIDENVLKTLTLHGLPYAADIERRFLLSKRIGALAEAKTKQSKPWLSCVMSDGRVHPRINHHGAVTGRCTHSGFNITGVPRVSSPFGAECRSLFTATPGWFIAGGDASGLELRMLAHFLAPYDGGQYADIVVNGDAHSVHQEYFGFEDHPSMSGRDRTKTMFYAWIYGAGKPKLGRIAMDGIKALTDSQARRVGAEKIGRFEERFAGLADLRASLNRHLTGLEEPNYRSPILNPWVRTLSGNKLKCRSTHSALNLICQGAGAVVMKLATVLVDERMRELGWKWRQDYGQVIHAHDELQGDCRTIEVANDFASAVVWAVPEAGRVLKLRCELAAESKIGRNWMETH